MNYEQLFYQYYHRYPENAVELDIFIEWYENKYRPVRHKSSNTWMVALALMVLVWFVLSGGILFPKVRVVPQIDPTAALFIVTNTPRAELPLTSAPIIITATPQPQPDTLAIQAHCQLDANLQPIGDCP